MILLNCFNIPAESTINVWPALELDEISAFSAAAVVVAAAAGSAKVGLSETPKCQRG